MRTPEATIRERILFPVAEIRTVALTYFARERRQDETLMPLVIQAVEQYGRDTAFEFLRIADALLQTETTIRWLTDELTKDWYLEDVNIDNYRTAVALILASARVDLLRPEMVDLPAFPEELKPMLLERLDMAAWDWETGWAALEQLGQATHARGDFSLYEVKRFNRIVEALARHPDKGPLVFSLLQVPEQHEDSEWIEWLEPCLVELVGQMHLTEAVPWLVARLHETDMFLVNSYYEALRWIGGDEVVRALAEEWPEGESDFRRWAAQLLEDIHTDLSATKCLEFLATEEDGEIRESLAHALLGNFVEEAVEPIRQMLLANQLPTEPEDVKWRLVAACTVMGQSFPEYHEWYKQAVAEAWGSSSLSSAPIRPYLAEDDFDEAGWFGDEESETALYDHEGLRPEPVRREQPHVGRNDPCPCGSGKKYKKCCLRKDRAELEGDSE